MAAKTNPNDSERQRFRGRWLPIAATTFVLFSLVVLAVIPALVFAWIDAGRRAAEVGALPARADAVRLGSTIEQQAAAARGYLLSGNVAYRDRYDRSRAQQLQALEQLTRVTPQVGPAAQSHLENARRLSIRWHEEHVRALDDRITAEEYDETLPRMEALHDSLFAHVDGLDDEIARAGLEQFDAVEAALGWQRTVSFGLGALAFLAALAVGWFARRQWHLTGAVERALLEENRLREQSERAHEELLRVTESRARLMRGFGHDVKNPLGAADGYLRLLAAGILGPLTERQNRAVHRASRSIGGALNLVDDLVDLARAEAGTLEIARVPTDLCAVIGEAADEYRAQAEAKGLDFRLELPEDCPLVATDGRRVRQVLGNLISNAVKFTDEGTVTIRLRFTPTDAATWRDRRVAIEVEDTGPGIPPEQQHRLFQEFVRLAAGAAPGAGLGLTIGQRLATALGGEITVDSAVGRGSRFTLLLPLRRASDLHAA